MAQTLTLAMRECLLHALECMLTRVVRKGRTAMHWAVDFNQPSCIDALAKMKADLNMRGGQYACFAACCGFKIDLKLYCRFIMSPLELAFLMNHRECLAVLEAAGAT